MRITIPMNSMVAEAGPKVLKTPKAVTTPSGAAQHLAKTRAAKKSGVPAKQKTVDGYGPKSAGALSSKLRNLLQERDELNEKIREVRAAIRKKSK